MCVLTSLLIMRVVLDVMIDQLNCEFSCQGKCHQSFFFVSCNLLSCILKNEVKEKRKKKKQSKMIVTMNSNASVIHDAGLVV